ncbi:hypothetical protein [Haliangium sp.]|uniref:hypothetical protein n=1 Tax=Haliangium sp. TaxID=2663208 RepID=UPI003D0BEBF6
MVTITAMGCGAGGEVSEVSLPMRVAGGLSPAETDLGYTVTVSRMRVAARDLTFKVPGDGLALGVDVGAVGFGDDLDDELGGPQGVLAPPEPAHPGHGSGGVVTGELAGDYVIDWSQGDRVLGTALLLSGDYIGADFGFRRAGPGDGLDLDDPLLGHSVHIEGTVVRDGIARGFDAVFDLDDGAQVQDIAFEQRIGDDAGFALSISLLITDPYRGETLFDGVDFAALAAPNGAHVAIRPGDEAANRIRRAVQVHDHYLVSAD